MGTECVLATTNRLKLVIVALCFGSIFLWILSGRYLDNDRAASSAKLLQSGPRSISRRLLESRDETEDVLNYSYTGTLGEIEEGSGYDPATAQCSNVHKVKSSDKCSYIKEVDSCQNDGGFLNYLKFIYCTTPPKFIIPTMILLFFWLVFLFIFLGITAEEYFCPALTVMSQVLHLSQNVAGVTLLALGNGAPDIFSAFAAISQNDDHKSSLAIGALFGAGIFVTTIVVGGVAFISSVQLTKRPFLRDTIFYIAAVFWTFYLLWTNTVNIFMGAGFIALYATYVMVVIFGRLINQKFRKWMESRQSAVTKASENEEGEEEKSAKLNRTTSEIQVNGHPEAKVYPDLKFQESTDEEKEEEVQVDLEENKRPYLSSPKLYHFHKHHPPESHHSDSESSTKGKAVTTSGSHLFSQIKATLLVPHAIHDGIRRSRTPTANMERGWKHRDSLKSEGDRPSSVDPEKVVTKTVLGALDQAEEVGVAVGLPHVPQMWDEVHRMHSPSPLTRSRESKKEEDAETVPLMSTPTRRPHPFVVFLKALNLFDEDFKQLSIVGKIYEILKYPCSIILILTIPVIDHTADLHNWNRWLNILQCVTAPTVLSLLTGYGLYLIGGVFPVCVAVLILGTFTAIAVACTSRNDRRPIYHCTFAWLGFAIAVVWIYAVANEIVNLLQAFGIVVKLSDAILGITLLAWGNSIGDAVSNMTVAKQGYSQMAIGACYGGPLLNMLIGIGIASVYKSIKRKAEGFKFKLYFTPVQFFAATFLLTGLAISLIAITFLRFRVRRPVAVFLIAFYALFLIVTVLTEVHVLRFSIHNVLSSS